MSVVKKCLRTVEPNEPVPPVMTKVLFLKDSVMVCMFASLLSIGLWQSVLIERIQLGLPRLGKMSLVKRLGQDLVNDQSIAHGFVIIRKVQQIV